jgi:signal transduction histidine kinase
MFAPSHPGIGPGVRMAINCIRTEKEKQAIIDLWGKRARDELPSARHQEEPALIDSLPDFLDFLFRTLSNDKEEKGTNWAIADQHGKHRAQSGGYDLEELIQEYDILRKTIFEVLERDGPLDPRERDIIVGTVMYAVKDATAEFARYRIGEETNLRRQIEEDVVALEMQRELREQFVLTLSHDMRNPLTAARAGAQLIMRNPGNVEILFKLGTRIVDNIDRVDNMIRDLLDASRVAAGERLALQLQECDLKAVVSDVIAEMSTVHGGRFIVRAPDGLKVWIDCDALRRALENMLTNAVKYGDQHQKITTSVETHGDNFELSVHNHGPCLSNEQQQRIFEPFHREHKPKDDTKGWGLGLTLVRGVAQSHGGTVRVKSAPAEGTTFTMILPVDARRLNVST